MVEFMEALKLGMALKITKKTQKLPFFESCGKILARDIHATRPLPPFNNSAMDGYALKFSDYGQILKIKGCILAGESAKGLEIRSGEAYKIMTGAPLPKGADSVVQLEHTAERGGELIITHKIDFKKGQNVRFVGEEIAKNEKLLQKGTLLTHLDVSIAASQGISEILCFMPLKIGIYSSGDEVIEPSQNALPHQIYNTNATSLFTLLQKEGYECAYRGIIKDNKESLHKAIAEFGAFDVVVTSGGASVGEKDLIKAVLLESGAKLLFDSVNVKPGRHLALAMLGNTVIILLPGNPLALLLHLHTLITPILRSLQGRNAPYPQVVNAKLNGAIKLKKETTSMILGRLESSVFTPHNGGKIGSSALSIAWRNNAILISQNRAVLENGECVKLISYNDDFCAIMKFLNKP